MKWMNRVRIAVLCSVLLAVMSIGFETSAFAAETPSEQHEEVFSIQFLNARVGFAGGNGFISRTSDGGRSWSKQYEGKERIGSLFFLNSKLGWAIGTSETGQEPRTVLHTEDGGRHWAPIAQVDIGTTIRFVNRKVGFSGGWMTANGGKTWGRLHVPDQVVGEPFFYDRMHGWAVTSDASRFRISFTTTGGEQWKTVLEKNIEGPLGGAVIRSTGQKNAWVLLIGGSGMSQTSYTLMHTPDGGRSWTTPVVQSTAGGGPAPGYATGEAVDRPGPNIKPGMLLALNGTTAFLTGECSPCGDAGEITIGWTHDGGKSWTNQAPKLPGQQAAVSFVDAKRGWLATRTYGKPSVLYATDNSGQSWKPVYSFR